MQRSDKSEEFNNQTTVHQHSSDVSKNELNKFLILIVFNSIAYYLPHTTYLHVFQPRLALYGVSCLYKHIFAILCTPYCCSSSTLIKSAFMTTYWAIVFRTLLANRAGVFFSSSVGICGGRNWKTEPTDKHGYKDGRSSRL